MKARFQSTNPDEIEFSLTVTMPLKEWKEVRRHLQGAWPSWELGQAIADMIITANSTFFPKETEQ